MIYVRKLDLYNFDIPGFNKSQYDDLVNYCQKGKLWPFRFIPSQEKGRVSYFEFHPIFTILEYIGFFVLIFHLVLIVLLNANSPSEYYFFPDNQLSITFYYYYVALLSWEMMVSVYGGWFAQFNLLKKQSRNYYRIIIKVMKSKNYTFEEMQNIVDGIQEEIIQFNAVGKQKDFLNFVPPFGECSPLRNLSKRKS